MLIKLWEILLDSPPLRHYLLPSATNLNLFPMATTKVILREKIVNLGSEADVVTVKAGFARNFLIPEGKAFEATKANLKHLESLGAQRTKRETEELQEAQDLHS
jgi:large subunit ribosomal protein L9